MIRFRVLFIQIILTIFWNQINSEDYLVGKVENVSGSQDIHLVTGSEDGEAQIGSKSISIQPYDRKQSYLHKGAVKITTSGNTVSVYGAFSSSFFSLLPISALGTKYIVSSCHQPSAYSSVLVIATHSEETNINITFHLNGTLTLDGKDYITGSTLSFSLGEFEARTIRSSFDLTGTVVRSQQSVAVFSGLVFRDKIVAYNQLLPVKHYGQEYVVAVDTALYIMQIISEHKDTRILFNNGSVICLGDSLRFRRALRNEHVFFSSSKPVMASLCRENGRQSGATVIPPVNVYTNISTMSARNVIKILTIHNATDVQVNAKSANVSIQWEDVPGTGYKIGTLEHRISNIVSITSDSNSFATLAYNTDYFFNGGYYFNSNPLSADTRRFNETRCVEAMPGALGFDELGLKDCNYHSNELKGHYTLPTTSQGVYVNHMRCDIVLVSSCVPHVTTINFIYFDVQHNENCTSDYLDVMLCNSTTEKLCRNDQGPFTIRYETNDPVLHMTFVTDRGKRYKGFGFDYRTEYIDRQEEYNCHESKPGRSCISKRSFTEDCDYRSENLEGHYILPTNSKGVYYNNMHCDIVLVSYCVPHVTTIHFTYFDTENCECDYVEVKTGNVTLDKLYGRGRGSFTVQYETNDTVLHMTFVTDRRKQYKGFEFNYRTECKDYLVAKVTEDFGFPAVERVAGMIGGGTVIGDESISIQPFEKKTIFSSSKTSPNTSIEIRSNGTSVNLYGFFGSSYFSLLPISALGTHYIVSSCRPPSEYTVMLVIATHSQKTNVTVTFKLNGTLSFEGQTYRDGSTLRLILDGFDARYISSSSDLTGTVVRSSQFVAVYSGLIHEENITAYSQLLPVNRFGQEYVVAVDDSTAPYQLQIISGHRDTSISFNNDSGICVGESGTYHRKLEKNETLFFTSSNPVMTSLCRVDELESGFTIVPPANAYTKNSAMDIRDVVKIFTDQNATDVTVRVKSKTVPVDWEEIPGSRFKVGTSKPDKPDIVSISSETSDFAVLAFHRLFTVNGGYNFRSNPQNTSIRLLDKIECTERKDVRYILDKIKQGSVGDIFNKSESEQSLLLEDISKIDSVSVSFEEVTAFVANITQDIKPSARNLKSIASIMENNNVTSNISKQTVENVLEIYNKVLETPPEILADAQGKDNVANRLLQIVDTITDRLEPPEGGNSTFVTESFTAVVFDLKKETSPESFPLGLQITETTSESETGNLKPIFKGKHNNTPSTDVQSESAVYFQEQFLQQTVKNNTGKNVRLSMNYYNQPVLFNVIQNSSKSSLKSKVISAKILVDGDSITDLSDTNITLIFPQNESQTTDPLNSFYSCVYWNFSGNRGTGSWSKGGCYLTKPNGQNKCVCNHLTNFAVLLDYYGQENAEPTHALVLSVITKIGLILSIVGLTTTAVSHVMFREKRLAVETRPQTTLFNLALAQLCSWVVFLVGIDRTENRVGCILVAALLHYFILASFMWMLAMAILYYLLFVKVIGTHTSRYMLKTGVPAWGIPVLPVVIVLAIDVDLYKGGESYCWMSVAAFYYAFGTPVGLILLINIVLYIMVVVSICRRTMTPGRSNQNRSYLKNIKASFLSFIILGLSWIFGFLAISDARVVFQYIFCITSSIQGFLIFVFFTLQDQRFRDNWWTWCCGLRKHGPPRHRSKQKPAPLSKTTSETTDPSKVTEDTV